MIPLVGRVIHGLCWVADTKTAHCANCFKRIKSIKYYLSIKLTNKLTLEVSNLATRNPHYRRAVPLFLMNGNLNSP
jgi:hypothetical protein